MDNLTQLRMRLYAAKRRNSKYATNMAKMPGIIKTIGNTPVVDANDIPDDRHLVSSSNLHKQVGGYYGKIMKRLQAEGVITKQNGMWHLREDLQKAGLAVYVTGRWHCYHQYFLRWTPKGVEYIRQIINQQGKA